MKLTDDIVNALRGCINDGYESVSEFARLSNVSANTLTKYLHSETESIKDETWKKMYPLLKPYLNKKNKTLRMNSKPLELTTDERILLDSFNDLTSELKKQKLMEIIELAKKCNSEAAAKTGEKAE